MNKPCRASSAPSFRILSCAATLLLCAAQGAVAGSIFRCVDASGHTEFRQTQCDAGSGQRLRLRVPKIGWLKPKTGGVAGPRTVEQETAEEASVDASPGPAEERRCWQAQQRLEGIQWQLRKGYKRAQGERLRQQRRQQQAFVSRFCK